MFACRMLVSFFAQNTISYSRASSKLSGTEKDARSCRPWQPLSAADTGTVSRTSARHRESIRPAG